MSEVPEGWAVVRLGDIVEVLDKYRIPLDEEYRRTIPGPYPYCGATGIIDYINDYIFDGEYLLVAEDGGKYGPFEETAYIMRGKFWANNHVHILKGKSGVVENVFLMYYLNLIDVRKHILGTTREKLNQEALRNIPILKPPLPEQRKIAEVLSKVDSLIERTEKIIEKYERIKRGLAQDLLTRGIDENGRIRSEETHEFKDSPIGRIPKEWKVIMLGKIINYHKGTKPVPGQPAVPYLDANGLRTKKFAVTSKKSVSVIAEKGDILLIWDGSNSGEFFKSPITGAVASTMVKITPTSKTVDTDYLYHVLKFKIEPHLRDSIQGTGIPHVSRYELENSIVPLPPLPEQRRIAQVLSQVDNILDKERRGLEKLKRLKRGLMNDLLSGKVRVTPLLEASK